MESIINKIRKEIERLKEEMDGDKALTLNQRVKYLLPLAGILDSLSEESNKSLEEEYKDYVENDPVYSKLVNNIVGMAIARHFYELGKNSK